MADPAVEKQDIFVEEGRHIEVNHDLNRRVRRAVSPNLQETGSYYSFISTLLITCFSP